MNSSFLADSNPKILVCVSFQPTEADLVRNVLLKCVSTLAVFHWCFAVQFSRFMSEESTCILHFKLLSLFWWQLLYHNISFRSCQQQTSISFVVVLIMSWTELIKYTSLSHRMQDLFWNSFRIVKYSCTYPVLPRLMIVLKKKYPMVFHVYKQSRIIKHYMTVRK